MRTLYAAALPALMACGCVAAQSSVTFVADEERNALVVRQAGRDVEVGRLDHKVEGSCAFAAADGHHLFLTDGDGGIHQYLTDLESLLYIRTLNVNPDTEACATDAAGEWLFYLDPATGVWRVPADPESDPIAEPVSLFEPWGALDRTTETIAAGLVAGAPARPVGVLPAVTAAIETAPVRIAGDVADDPAILVNTTGGPSLVLGADKAEGLRVYSLDGRELQFLPVGRLNNVDVRIVDNAGVLRAFAAASNRTHGRLDLFEIDLESGRVTDAGAWPVDLDDPYGVCVTKSGPFEVMIGDTEGHVQRWAIDIGRGQIDAAFREEIVFGSQTEGCAVDAAGGMLYVGEEDVGVWRVPLAAPAGRSLLIAVSTDGLVPDVEGMALVDSRDGGKLLVVSSQGDDSFVLYDLAAERIRLKFSIGMSFATKIDGVSETDGLDVTTATLPGFPDGLLVVQDGRNVAPSDRQNFKLVSWGAVEVLMR